MRDRVEVRADFRGWPRARDYDPGLYGWPRNKGRAEPVRQRRWSEITALVIHSTDVDEMGPGRFLGVPCHGGVPAGGGVVLCHDLRAYLNHANAANRFSVGIEIAGRSDIADDQIEPARELARYMVDEIRRHRPGRVAVMSHRMSSVMRGNDPGARPWREVGLWLLANVPGTVLGPVVGTGRPNPPSWAV